VKDRKDGGARELGIPTAKTLPRPLPNADIRIQLRMEPLLEGKKTK